MNARMTNPPTVAPIMRIVLVWFPEEFWEAASALLEEVAILESVWELEGEPLVTLGKSVAAVERVGLMVGC